MTRATTTTTATTRECLAAAIADRRRGKQPICMHTNAFIAIADRSPCTLRHPHTNSTAAVNALHTFTLRFFVSPSIIHSKRKGGGGEILICLNFHFIRLFCDSVGLCYFLFFGANRFVWNSLRMNKLDLI